MIQYRSASVARLSGCQPVIIQLDVKKSVGEYLIHCVPYLVGGFNPPEKY